MIGTPILMVTMRPNRSAKAEEKRTEVASQKFEPILRMDRKSETKVRFMDR